MPRLRKGIFFEVSRGRFRVRLYKFNRVTHCSYHKNLKEAEQTLDAALGNRKRIEQPKPKVAAALTIENMLGGLVAQQ